MGWGIDMKTQIIIEIQAMADDLTAVAAYHVFPTKWEKPSINHMPRPIHVATSGADPSNALTPALYTGTDRKFSLSLY